LIPRELLEETTDGAGWVKDWTTTPGRVRKAYKLWCRDHSHPSLEFKKVGKVWSARIDEYYRALAALFISPHWRFAAFHGTLGFSG